MVQIFDLSGQQQDWDWVQATYGGVKLREYPTVGPAFRVVEIHERAGAATLIVTVLDEDGAPYEGVSVGRRWPDDALPELPEDLNYWYEQGVYGAANADGNVGFGMGGGDYYEPDKKAGASSVWCGGPSDCVDGLGMLWATDHRHLDITFQYLTNGDDEEPEPPQPPGPPPVNPEKIEQILALLDGVRTLLLEMVEECCP